MKGEMTEHGFDPRLYQRDLLNAWESFVDTGALDSDLVPEYVAESWQRAQNRKIDPFHIPPSAYLDPIAYGKRKEENRYLVSIAKPFMENMYRYLEKSLYLIVLYDSTCSWSSCRRFGRGRRRSASLCPSSSGR